MGDNCSSCKVLKLVCPACADNLGLLHLLLALLMCSE